MKSLLRQGGNYGGSSAVNRGGQQSAAAQKAFSYQKRGDNSKYGRNISNAKAYLAGGRDKNGNHIPQSVINNNRGASYIPSPQRANATRMLGEEQKRANSVASGDTINSTASSSSPMKKRVHMKNNLQQMGLQITGAGQR